MTKQRKKGVIISVIVVLLMIGGVLLVTLILKDNAQKRSGIPIAFFENMTREDCFFICSDGELYLGFSEETFLMSLEDIAERIQKNDYDDILKHVGSVSKKEVKEKYALFQEVCLAEGYHLDDTSYDTPNGEHNYDDAKRFWMGVHPGEDGKMERTMIYQSGGTHACSDKRAYEIVKWMDELVVKYAK